MRMRDYVVHWRWGLYDHMFNSEEDNDGEYKGEDEVYQ